MDLYPSRIPPYDCLLPKPLNPGLYTAVGDRGLISFSLRAIAVTFTPRHRISWIDAANQFNAHWIAQSARAFHKDSRESLRAFHYARPFTAFQLEAMVNLKLLPAMQSQNALFAVIADPLTLYEQAENQSYSITRSFELFTGGLKMLARQIALLLLIPSPKESPSYRKLLQLSDRIVYPNLPQPLPAR